jgi:hypothetical protein
LGLERHKGALSFFGDMKGAGIVVNVFADEHASEWALVKRAYAL